MGIQIITREFQTAVPITFFLMNIYLCDLETRTAGGLRCAGFQSELKNSFWRSRNRYRRFASARSQSTDSPPKKKKLWEDFSKKKKFPWVAMKKKKNSHGVFKLKSDNYAATISFNRPFGSTLQPQAIMLRLIFYCKL